MNKFFLIKIINKNYIYLNMFQICFIYEGNKTYLQYNENVKMKEICNRFSSEIGKELNTLIFCYNGNNLNEDLLELSLGQNANNLDKERKKMDILIYDIKAIEQNIIIKPKEIIYPEYSESIRISIKDYKIKLFECKNNHNINMLLNEFDNSQNIYEKKIICDKCKSNKSNS